MDFKNILNNNDDKFVMIFEKSKTNLDFTKDDGKYVLEGVFAQFGVENNNGRIYEENDYLPHLTYLNEKISKRRLVGELDHPEKFDISLNNASHIIEKLEYDKSKRQVTGRVRLLDTPKGQIAKALIDAGVPISISSRAAGVVENNKKVKLRRIFTYDLVMDPGFNEAQLHSVNESFDFLSTRGLFDKLTNINESLGIDSTSMTQIYTIQDEDLNKDLLQILESEKNKINKMDNKFVTIEELQNYSLIIKGELEKLKESIQSIKPTTEERVEEGEKKDLIIDELKEKVTVLEGYIKYLAENLDQNISYSKYLAENQDKNISYVKYLAENQDKNISYVKYLAENQDKNISYMKYLAENQDKNISFSKYLAENLDYTMTTVNESNETIAELSENLKVTIDYTDYLKDAVQESVNSKTTEVVALKEDKSGKKKEEKIEESLNVNYKNLSSDIKTLIESVKKQRTDSLLMEKKYTFFNVLSPSNQQAFLSLDETKKEKVSNSILEGNCTTEAEILKLWENALVEKCDQPVWIAQMPEKYKSVWESLNEGEKNKIASQAALRKLETAYQVKNFWDTRVIGVTPIGLQSLNESVNPIAQEKNDKKDENLSKMGYSSEYIQKIKKELDRFKK